MHLSRGFFKIPKTAMTILPAENFIKKQLTISSNTLILENVPYIKHKKIRKEADKMSKKKLTNKTLQQNKQMLASRDIAY